MIRGYHVCTKYKGIIVENYHHLVCWNYYHNKEKLANAIQFLYEYDKYRKHKHIHGKGTFKSSGKEICLNGNVLKKWDFAKLCMKDFIERSKR